MFKFYSRFIIFLLPLLLTGCINTSSEYDAEGRYIGKSTIKQEMDFDAEVKKIFQDIDNTLLSIKSVEEKQKLEKVPSSAPSDATGSNTFFKKSVLQRFSNE